MAPNCSGAEFTKAFIFLSYVQILKWSSTLITTYSLSHLKLDSQNDVGKRDFSFEMLSNFKVWVTIFPTLIHRLGSITRISPMKLFNKCKDNKLNQRTILYLKVFGVNYLASEILLIMTISSHTFFWIKVLIYCNGLAS